MTDWMRGAELLKQWIGNGTHQGAQWPHLYVQRQQPSPLLDSLVVQVEELVTLSSSIEHMLLQ